jgi:hypothetical protein
MAKALSRKKISVKNGPEELHGFLRQYQAQYFNDSSTEKGHVYWSAPISQWILVVKKGNDAIVTFHHHDDCPCKKL